MIANDRQLENTRRKLTRLEERVTVVQERLRNEPDRDATRVTLHSYRQLVRQLREEIGRYELGIQPPPPLRLDNHEQLRNTGRKLCDVEGRIQKAEAVQAAGQSSQLAALSLRSLRRLRNQLAEEIARYEIGREESVESTAADR